VATRWPATLFDLVGRRIVPHDETKNLRRRAGDRRHRQFAFPSFAEPTFLRDLLDVAGALTLGTGVVERQPGIIGKQKGKENDKQLERAEASSCVSYEPSRRVLPRYEPLIAPIG
jgi:hypothetical protein